MCIASLRARSLWLGAYYPHDRGLAGHSDADVRFTPLSTHPRRARRRRYRTHFPPSTRAGKALPPRASSSTPPPWRALPIRIARDLTIICEAPKTARTAMPARPHRRVLGSQKPRSDKGDHHRGPRLHRPRRASRQAVTTPIASRNQMKDSLLPSELSRWHAAWSRQTAPRGANCAGRSCTAASSPPR